MSCLRSTITQLLILAILLVVAPTHDEAQAAEENVMLVLDASGSMWGKVGDKTKIEIAREVIDDLLKAARAYKRRYGKSPEELLLDIAYKVEAGAEATLAQQLKAVTTYLRQTMPSSSENTVNVNRPTEPAIYLPEQLPDRLQVNRV